LGEQIYQRRLTGSVWTNDAHAFSWSEIECDVVKDRIVVFVSERDLMCLDHRGAEARDVGHEVERADARGALGSTGQEPLRGVESSLGLCRTSFDASAEPRQFSSGEVATNLFGRGCPLLAFCLNLEQSRVATGVNERLASVDLDHSSRDLIEEEPIVTHQDYGAPKTHYLLFEPLDGVEVEVVRGLVEDQYAEFFAEDLSQRDALELAAGEILRFDVGLVKHSEAVECGVDLPARAEGFTNGARRQPGDLLQEADANVATTANCAGVGDERSGDDSEQRRLADTVDSDHTDSISRGDGQGKSL
jgi:hypothetical protein